MTLFNAINEQSEPLALKVANQISELIQNRRLNIGERLPNEYELALELQVGRGTVREAVKLLVARNVLVIKRGKGTFVAKNPGVVDDPLGFNYIQDKLKLSEDLLEVRSLIEPWVASAAAVHATPDEIKKIEAQCEVVETQILDGVPHGEEDVMFHTLIAKATDNQVVSMLIPIINQSVELLTVTTNWSLGNETIETHRRIVNAIKAHNPQDAEKAMMDHLDYNRDCLAKIRNEQ